MFKKLIVVAVLALIVQKWDVIQYHLNPPKDFVADENVEVILYATSWCGYCAKARALMAEHNIDYIEYDIEASDEGKQQYQKHGGGGVPLLLIDGQLVRGYNPKRILELAGGS
jgi:glutaredoxin